MGGDELAQQSLMRAEFGGGEAGDGVTVEPAGDGGAGVGRDYAGPWHSSAAVVADDASRVRGEVGFEIGGDGTVAIGTVGQRGPISDIGDEKPDD